MNLKLISLVIQKIAVFSSLVGAFYFLSKNDIQTAQLILLMYIAFLVENKK
jgi:hypothetical protein